MGVTDNLSHCWRKEVNNSNNEAESLWGWEPPVLCKGLPVEELLSELKLEDVRSHQCEGR